MHWLDNLEREARIRKGIIFYGNTRDEFFDRETKQFLLLPKYLQYYFKRKDFTVSGLWSPTHGLQFLDDVDKSTFSRWLSTNLEDSMADDVQGDDFDIGDIDEADEADVPKFNDINELTAALSGVLEVNDQPAVFILDWSDFRFGTVQSPFMEEDRRLLENFSLVFTGTRGMGSPSSMVRKAPGVVIIVTANLGSLPPALYQTDARVKLFSAPSPDRPARAQFFDNYLDDLKIQRDSEKPRKRVVDDLADMTEGLKYVDLMQILRLSALDGSLTPEKLVNLYKFGQKRSPWEDLSDDKLRSVEEELKRRVVGQEEAVSHVATTVIKAAMGLSGIQHSAKLSKPKGVLFFVGPTGVGKTELAKATAEFIFGDESACLRFDMSEYNHEESDQKLIGAPPGFVGYEEGGQLTNAVIERPFSVLLFDEIEKAHPRILDKFLQIFEDGRLTDSKGVTAYFSETILIFTSNIGAAEASGVKDSEIVTHYLTMVKDHFNKVLERPELLNRIGDNIVVFNNITDREFRSEIIRRKLSPLRELVKEKYNVNLLIDEELYPYFESKATKEHGGRGLLNAAEKILINPLALFMFENKPFLTDGRKIRVFLTKETPTKIDFDLQE